MKMLKYVGVFAVACMSGTLGACVMAEPDEADVDAADTATATAAEAEAEAEPKAAPESLAQPVDDASGPACGGSGAWCLARCSRTGDYENIVGKWGSFGGSCSSNGETYCHSHYLGYRTHACWGHL